MDQNMMKMLAKTFRERQINRLDKVVGVNDTTSGLVEEGYTRILEICKSLDKLNILYNDTNIQNFMIYKIFGTFKISNVKNFQTFFKS